jgi:uncharacterized protein with PQ loop repeat
LNPSSILGLLGTIIGLVRALPQLIAILRSQKASGVSVDATATSFIVSFGWTVYGFLTSQPYVCLATGSSGIIFLFITVFALRFGRQAREFKIAPFWLCVLLLAYHLAGGNGLGLVLAVSILAANMPQLWVAYKESNLSDLSLGTWLLSMSDGFIWGIYSFLQQDFSIMIFAFFQLSTSGMIVVLKLLRNKIRLRSK